MKNPLIEDVFEKFSEVMSRSPAKDMEQNAKALLKSMLHKMDLASSGELETLQALLAGALAQISALQAQVSVLEARMAELETRGQVPTGRLSDG